MSSSPLRVLHVVHSLDPGGMENGLVNIARLLAPKGISTHVACLERPGAWASRLPDPGCVRVLGKRIGFSPQAVWRLAREVARVQPSVVHTHNLGPLIYAAPATAWGRWCPILHGEHSALTAEELAPRRLRQRRVLYRACHTVHAVSKGIIKELHELGLSPRGTQLTSNGVDSERFRPGNRRDQRLALGLPETGLIVGAVGRFGSHKRHGLLLDAWEKVAAQHPGAVLLIVGGGGPEESPARARAAASAFAGRIHFAGFQSDPLPWYQTLDLLVVPSVNEGLSNVLLEAMACGVPALVNEGCGHEEVITTEHDGRIADLNEADRLATHVDAVLRNASLCAQWSREARITVQTRFSIQAMADRYEQLYRSIAAPPHNTP